MNLQEIADRQTAIGKHRLRMSAARKIPMGAFCDLYVGGNPMLSMQAAPDEEGRTLLTQVAARLGPDVIALTYDSYFRVGPNLLNHVPGSMGAAFAAGDPSVSEALTIATASNDEAQITQAIPYTRLRDGRIKFEVRDLAMEVASAPDGEVTGRVSDEIVEILNGGLDPAFAAHFVNHGHEIPGVLLHVYDRSPWSSIQREADFLEHWTKTSAGHISMPPGRQLANAISVMDLTMSGDAREDLLYR